MTKGMTFALWGPMPCHHSAPAAAAAVLATLFILFMRRGLAHRLQQRPSDFFSEYDSQRVGSRRLCARLISAALITDFFLLPTLLMAIDRSKS